MKILSFLVFAVCFAPMADAADADNKEEPAPAGPITVAVKLDRREYMHGEPGVSYVMAPTGKLKATLIARNVTDKAITVEFRSSQQYDFIIRDAKGKELIRWSTDKGFMAVIQEVELAAAEQWSFEEELPLGGVGKPLPEGEYVLEAVLTCHPPLTATAKFKIVPTPAR
jgi:hypothetical protein